eukprot:Hpha_TRINITY_DN30662_c0_g1::TRINITY_DN30662_c0_g1_i1::g.18206::m.18206
MSYHVFVEVDGFGRRLAEVAISATVRDLVEMVRKDLELAGTGELSYMGERVPPETTLADAGIGPETTVSLSTGMDWKWDQEFVGADGYAMYYDFSDEGKTATKVRMAGTWTCLRTTEAYKNSGDAVSFKVQRPEANRANEDMIGFGYKSCWIYCALHGGDGFGLRCSGKVKMPLCPQSNTPLGWDWDHDGEKLSEFVVTMRYFDTECKVEITVRREGKEHRIEHPIPPGEQGTVRAQFAGKKMYPAISFRTKDTRVTLL